jgi:hypothetical protein
MVENEEKIPSRDENITTGKRQCFFKLVLSETDFLSPFPFSLRVTAEVYH